MARPPPRSAPRSGWPARPSPSPTPAPPRNYALDIALSTCIQNYITSHYTYVGYISGFGYQYRAASGNLYTKEGSHWDILFYTCGC
ncbi:hypothetical protein AB0I37_08775 [Micromonospora purpureochromogenes]|uniref:hypothetical protein n=1 Tax=Micromonospora purpureochromogenes TaxID=47872 RepID=UPI0033DC418D